MDPRANPLFRPEAVNAYSRGDDVGRFLALPNRRNNWVAFFLLIFIAGFAGVLTIPVCEHPVATGDSRECRSVLKWLTDGTGTKKSNCA